MPSFWPKPVQRSVTVWFDARDEHRLAAAIGFLKRVAHDSRDLGTGPHAPYHSLARVADGLERDAAAARSAGRQIDEATQRISRTAYGALITAVRTRILDTARAEGRLSMDRVLALASAEGWPTGANEKPLSASLVETVVWDMVEAGLLADVADEEQTFVTCDAAEEAVPYKPSAPATPTGPDLRRSGRFPKSHGWT